MTSLKALWLTQNNKTLFKIVGLIPYHGKHNSQAGILGIYHFKIPPIQGINIPLKLNW